LTCSNASSRRSDFEDAHAPTEADRQAVRSNASTQEKSLRDNAMTNLKNAERKASGDERLAIQMEIAQRSRQRGEYAQCIDYYNRVAANTDQLDPFESSDSGGLCGPTPVPGKLCAR
jgi:hypothetical protein